MIELPPPKTNDREAVQDAVVVDLIERKAVGIQRYGTPLQPFNHRNGLEDAYQEALDLAVYIKHELVVREDVRRAALDLIHACRTRQNTVDCTDELLRLEELICSMG